VLLANVCVVVAGAAQGYVLHDVPKKMVPVTVFQLITGGALQKIGELDITRPKPVQQQEYQNTRTHSRKKTGSRYTMWYAASSRAPQRSLPMPLPLLQGDPITLSTRSKLSVHAITDVDIKAKLDLRGTAAARKELKNWRRSQAGT
jgi:hypothetical protein